MEQVGFADVVDFRQARPTVMHSKLKANSVRDRTGKMGSLPASGGSIQEHLRIKRLAPPVGAAVGLIGLLASLSLFYLGVVLNIPLNPDVGNLMLAAESIIDGNILLKGWTFGTIAFFTTEIPHYVAAVLLLGFTWKVIYILAALHWASIAALAIYLGATGEGGKPRLSRLFVALCLSMYVATFAVNDAYLSSGHLVAFAYLLICLLCIRKIGQTVDWPYYLGYGFFLTITLMGDSFGLYLMAIPVSLVCLIKIAGQGLRRTTVSLLLITLFSVILSRAAWELLALLGGATLPGPSADVADLSALANHISLVMGGVLQLFAIPDPRTAMPAIELALGLVRLSGLALFVWALGQQIVEMPKLSLYTQILVGIVVINLLENVASARGGSPRYLLPSLIFGIPLVSEVVYESSALKFPSRLVFPYFVILLLCLMPPLSFSRPASQSDGIARNLLQLHLTNGYGPYWGASTITILTAGKATVRPVYLQNGSQIAPYLCISDPTWYGSYANFLVINKNDSSGLQPTRSQAASTFGSPSGIYSLGDYGDLLVWDHDITPQLSPPSPCNWRP